MTRRPIILTPRGERLVAALYGGAIALGTVVVILGALVLSAFLG